MTSLGRQLNGGGDMEGILIGDESTLGTERGGVEAFLEDGLGILEFSEVGGDNFFFFASANKSKKGGVGKRFVTWESLALLLLVF